METSAHFSSGQLTVRNVTQRVAVTGRFENMRILTQEKNYALYAAIGSYM